MPSFISFLPFLREVHFLPYGIIADMIPFVKCGFHNKTRTEKLFGLLKSHYAIHNFYILLEENLWKKA